MCLYENIAHILTLVLLCMNEIKYEHMLSNRVYVKGLLTYVYTHENMSINACMMIQSIEGLLKGVLKGILNYMVLEYVMSMLKVLSHDLGV